MKRAGLYVRVSSQEQKKHGLSVDSQIVALREYCKENNMIEAGLYNDAGISARKKYTNRPALLQLMQDCKDGKIDIILFTKLDRWFRSVADYYEVQKVLEDCKVPWRCIWEDYETQTSAGVFKVNIMLSVAQSEADRTSERIKAVNDYRRTNGVYISGRATLGYKVVKGKLEKDPASEEAVISFFKEYLSSMNMTKAVGVLKAHGFSATRQTVKRMLRNEAYIGNACGTECEPYLTKQEFEIIQRSVSSNRVVVTNPIRYSNYIFNGGILRCPHCGKAMSGTYRKIKGHYYVYYRCDNYGHFLCENQRSITEMKLERELLALLEPELNKYNAEIKAKPQVKTNAEAKIKSLKAKLERIGDRYEEGDITRDEYKLKRTAILNEIEQYKVLDSEELKPIHLNDNWLDVYKELTPDSKKAFWVSICRMITLDKVGSIKIVF